MSNHDRDLSSYFQPQRSIALSFHWWVWLLFLLAASLPDQLEPATPKQSHFRSHRGLFHTYSVWIVLGLTIFGMPTAPLTISGIPVFNAGVKVLVWIFLAGSAVPFVGLHRQSSRVLHLSAVPLRPVGGVAFTNGALADIERRCRVQKSRATISRAAYPCHRRPPARA
jgi:hypothetical protein